MECFDTLDLVCLISLSCSVARRNKCLGIERLRYQAPTASMELLISLSPQSLEEAASKI